MLRGLIWCCHVLISWASDAGPVPLCHVTAPTLDSDLGLDGLETPVSICSGACQADLVLHVLVSRPLDASHPGLGHGLSVTAPCPGQGGQQTLA